VDGRGLDLDISGVLVVSSWLVGLYVGSESVSIGNVVNLPVDSVSIGVAVTSLHVSFAIADFFAVLSEFSIVTSYVVAKVVGSWDTVIVTWCISVCWGTICRGAISASVWYSTGDCDKGGDNGKLWKEKLEYYVN